MISADKPLRMRTQLTPALGPAEVGRSGVYRDKALKSLDRLPPLSPLVGRLLSKLAFRNVNYGELAGLVEKDALLCAHILSAVNSARFARARTITSVTQAMSLLGTNTLRRIAVGFTVANLFSKVKPARSWSRIRFNLHSGATAILAEAIARRLPIENEGAFVAGMMHDIGRLLIAVGLPEEYEMVLVLSAMTGAPVVDCERERLGTDHAELSALALLRWGIPGGINQAAHFHHTPDAPGAPTLAVVLHRADRFVNYLGITVDAPKPAVSNGDLPEPPSLRIPGFEFDEQEVLQEFEDDWKELAQFFS